MAGLRPSPRQGRFSSPPCRDPEVLARARRAAFQFALGQSADDLSPAAVEALSAILYSFFFPFVVGLVATLLAVAAAILRQRLLHPAFAWAALLLAVAALTPAGFFALIASSLWIVALSVALYLRGEQAPPTVPGSSPAPPS